MGDQLLQIGKARTDIESVLQKQVHLQEKGEELLQHIQRHDAMKLEFHAHLQDLQQRLMRMHDLETRLDAMVQHSADNSMLMSKLSARLDALEALDLKGQLLPLAST